MCDDASYPLSSAEVRALRPGCILVSGVPGDWVLG